MGTLLGGFETAFGIASVLIIGMVIAALVRGIVTWNRDNQAPRLSADAAVLSKRMEHIEQQQPNAGDASGAHGFYVTTSTLYRVCFQIDGGDRMEFQVDGGEYRRISEGDHGKLRFQGTRYLGFEKSL